jgi:GAF domain-containing protein
VSKGIAGWVVSSGQPIAVHDVRADPRFAVDVAESTGFVPRSILAAPLTAHGEALGVVEVLDRTPATDRGDDLDLLGLLATQAALAVELVSRPTADQPVAQDLAGTVQALRRLDADEQRTALALMGEFLAYTRRRGGTTGME